MLEVRALSKSFGGLAGRRSGARSTCAQGEIVGLIGPNGAGKTTLFAAIAGFHAARCRQRRLRGQRHHRPAAAQDLRRAAWCARSRSRSRSPRSAVRENIMVGAYFTPPTRGAGGRARGRGGGATAVGHGGPARPDGRRPHCVAGRKRLELARALATRPRLLLLDEVMAGPQSHRDRRNRRRSSARIRRSGVTSSCSIEHVMQAVTSLARTRLCAEPGPHDRRGHAGVDRRRPAGDRGLSRPRRAPAAAACLRSQASARATALSRCCAASSLDGRRGRDRGRCWAATAPASRRSTTTSRGLYRPFGRHDPLRRQRTSRGTPSMRIVEAGPHPGAGRPPRLPNLSVRENLELGSYRRGRAARREQPRSTCCRSFRGLDERLDADRRHAVGRRAADAGDRPRPDERAQAADPRRAVARPLAAAGRGACSP